MLLVCFVTRWHINRREDLESYENPHIRYLRQHVVRCLIHASKTKVLQTRPITPMMLILTCRKCPASFCSTIIDMASRSLQIQGFLDRGPTLSASLASSSCVAHFDVTFLVSLTMRRLFVLPILLVCYFYFRLSPSHYEEKETLASCVSLCKQATSENLHSC